MMEFKNEPFIKGNLILFLFVCITFKAFVLLCWISCSFTDILGLF